MIAVIDYGVGNLFSLTASLAYIGAEARITRSKEDLQNADRIILPGVGAFADARQKLEETGLVETIQEQAAAGKPLLGICLGMQLLFDQSYEYGEHRGLGLVPGIVDDISKDLTQELKVPHIGWNSLHFVKNDPLFQYIREGEYVYYVHSYYAKECTESTIATSEYNIQITGAVRNGSVYGTQFHPEKSGRTGLNLLRAFNELKAIW